MKTTIKKFMFFINIILSKFSYKILITRHNKLNNSIVLNKVLWQSFYKNCEEFELYKEGMEISNSLVFDNVYKQLRFYSLQNIFNNILKNKIKGDIVECGVWKGHSAYILASMIEKYDTNKKFHIFDSFEGGLSEKTLNDANELRKLSENDIKLESELFSSTKNEVTKTLKKFNFIEYYEGWIPDKFYMVEDKKFSFIHIDVDLYEPTRDSLNFFYKRLEKGGAIAIDDYGLTQFPGAKKAVDEFLINTNYSFFYKVPFGSCFIIK